MQPDPRHRPQILILPGTHDCANLGDLAMLQVALDRLRTLWPAAILRALTHNPEALRTSCPGVEPVPLRGRNRWLKVQALPRWVFPGIRPQVRRRFRISAGRAWKLGMFLWPSQLRMTRQFAEAMFNSDLLVMAGCGGLTDVFGYNARRILDTFDAAHRAGLPTAMLSQGIGPIEDPELRRRAAEVLPQVGRILIRERRATLPLLRQAGMAADRIVVTGDDAVELAFRERRSRAGAGLGVNLRLARYSELDPGALGVVRQVLGARSRERGTRILGFPILGGSGPGSDHETLERLFHGWEVDGDAGRGLRTPVEVVRRISECGVVVTGSYHGGVFALSQGIPVLGLAESAYYRDKFLGLADQFGAGCAVVRPGEPDLAGRLGRALDELASQGEALRSGLLQAAQRQVEAGRAAYRQLSALVAGG